MVAAVTLAVASGCASTTIPSDDGVPGPNQNQRVGDEEGEQAWVKRTPLIVPAITLEPDEDYVLGPRDTISVSIDDLQRSGEPTKLTVDVSQTGRASLPLAGDVTVANLSARGARDAIAAAMQKYLRVPQVTVQIENHRSKVVHIQGAVARTGSYSFPRNRISLVEALSLAGGLSLEAGRNAIVVRAAPDGAEQFLVNLEQMLVKSGNGRAMMIEAGDTIHIPEADKVFVIGYVYKPGGYALRGEMTALELVAQAGGPIPRQASASETFLRRRTSNGNFRIMKLDIEDIAAGEASDVVLAAGDTIVVPQTGSRFFANETYDILKGRIPGVPTPGFP